MPLCFYLKMYRFIDVYKLIFDWQKAQMMVGKEKQKYFYWVTIQTVGGGCPIWKSAFKIFTFLAVRALATGIEGRYATISGTLQARGIYSAESTLVRRRWWMGSVRSSIVTDSAILENNVMHHIQKGGCQTAWHGLQWKTHNDRLQQIDFTNTDFILIIKSHT